VTTTTQWLDLAAGVGGRADQFRFDVVNAHLSAVGTIDIKQTPVATVVNNINSTIKRTLECQPVIGALDGVDLFTLRIRPVMILPDGTEYNLGVFLPADASAVRWSYGSNVESMSFVDQGLIVDQPLQHAFGVDVGGSVKTAIETLLTAAGITTFQIDVDATVTSPMGWPPGTSRQHAINQLAARAGGYSMFFDGDGVARVIAAPALDSPTLTYSTTSPRIVAGSIVTSDDTLDAPNRYIVISMTGDGVGVAAVGTYDIDSAAPHSILNRGFVVARVLTVDGLTSAAAATAAAQTWAKQGSRNYQWMSFTSPLDPRHGTFDVVSVDVGDGAAVWREQGWSMRLISGGLMTHDLRRSW